MSPKHAVLIAQAKKIIINLPEFTSIYLKNMTVSHRNIRISKPCYLSAHTWESKTWSKGKIITNVIEEVFYM